MTKWRVTKVTFWFELVALSWKGYHLQTANHRFAKYKYMVCSCQIYGLAFLTRNTCFINRFLHLTEVRFLVVRIFSSNFAMEIRRNRTENSAQIGGKELTDGWENWKLKLKLHLSNRSKFCILIILTKSLMMEELRVLIFTPLMIRVRGILL